VIRHENLTSPAGDAACKQKGKPVDAQLCVQADFLFGSTKEKNPTPFAGGGVLGVRSPQINI